MKNPGRIVKTKEDPVKIGTAYNKGQSPVWIMRGKILVTWEDGTQTIKSLDKIEFIGFVD